MSDNIERTMSLLGRGEHVHDTVDGLGGRARVQCAEHEVAVSAAVRARRMVSGSRFRRPARRRVFAQCRSQSLGEPRAVTVYFALIHQAALGLVHELDRVFDRDDMVGTIVVAVVDHAGQGRGLARPVGPSPAPVRRRRGRVRNIPPLILSLDDLQSPKIFRDLVHVAGDWCW